MENKEEQLMCSNCKNYTENNKFNGNCRRLSMMILSPQPNNFIVRSEFYCNLHEEEYKFNNI